MHKSDLDQRRMETTKLSLRMYVNMRKTTNVGAVNV